MTPQPKKFKGSIVAKGPKLPTPEELMKMTEFLIFLSKTLALFDEVKETPVWNGEVKRHGLRLQKEMDVQYLKFVKKQQGEDDETRNGAIGQYAIAYDDLTAWVEYWPKLVRLPADRQTAIFEQLWTVLKMNKVYE